ncbi:MAG: putative metalloprotease CJM1_0395 family protein [Gammaproteobacteria bacterium]
MISTIQPAAPAFSARPPAPVQSAEANTRADNAPFGGGDVATDSQAPSGQRVEGSPRSAAVGDAPSEQTPSDQDALTTEERRDVEKLKARDREVRAHEQAHLAAAGSLAQGGPTYTYERGPDQQLYAVGGEVQIDTSEVAGDPQATIQKAQIIRRAALAPAEPSSQDRAVAAEASQMAAAARMELAAEKTGSSEEDADANDEADDTLKSEKASGSCPACGGAHSSEAHEGMVAYAAQSEQATPQPSLAMAV